MVHVGNLGCTVLDRERSPLVRFRTRDHAVERFRQEIAERLRCPLNFAPAVEMAAPDTFEKPGIHNVARIVREASSHDDVKGR